jgi:regulator of sigma E protease
MIFLTIIVFIAILGLLVFVHELGHFIVAKKSGMKVEEFGFGFPPRVFGIKRGETLYSINLIPLGGFVKILGEDGSETPDPQSFGHKPAWKRFLVLIAGVTMNVILGWVLISIGLGLGLPTVIGEGDQVPKSAKVRDASVAIVEIAPNSPADSAGLKVGDDILKVNDQPISSIDSAQEATAKNAGNLTTYLIKRGSSTFTKTITPRLNPPAGEGPLGIALSSIAYVSYPWYEVLFRGFYTTYNLVVATLIAFGSLIGQWFAGKSVGGSISGPVGIALLTRDMTQLGFVYLLQFTALLSVNLAIINAVPFPALDGGRVLFLIIEKIRRKKLPVKAEQIANTVGFMLLLLLMLLVTVHDVSKFSDQFVHLFQRIKQIL